MTLSPVFYRSLVWLFIIVGAFLLRDVLLPFILAVLLAYVLNPLVRSLQSVIRFRNKTAPRWVAVLLLYILIAGLFTLILAVFLPLVYTELLKFGDVITKMITLVNQEEFNQYLYSINLWLAQYHIPFALTTVEPNDSGFFSGQVFQINVSHLLADIGHRILQFLQMQSADIVVQIQHAIVKTTTGFVIFFLSFMMAAFILMDTHRIHRFLFSLVPNTQKNSFSSFVDRLDARLSGVVRGQLLICLINAILTLIGLLILGVKFALTLASIAGIFSLIPIFGTIISTIPIAFVALLSSPKIALLAVCWIIGIHFIEGHILNPKILGSSAKIHPVLIVLALLAGEHYFGLMGAFLAVPISSIIITFFLALLNKAESLEEGVAKEL